MKRIKIALGTIVACCLGSDVMARVAAQGPTQSPPTARVAKAPAEGQAVGHDDSSSRAAIIKALKGRPELRGAWLRGIEAPIQDARGVAVLYEVEAIVDSAHADELTSRLRKLLMEYPFGLPTRITRVTTIPVTEFVTRLNVALEGRRTCDGCWVESARIDGEVRDKQLKLMLVCRVASDAQRGLVRDVANEPSLLNKLPQFVFAVEVEQAYRLELNAHAARVLYGEGLECYRRGDYSDATVAFRQAVIEDPGAAGYRYWMIASLLRCGNDRVALDHMEALTRRGPLSHRDYQSAMRSLERLQGYWRGKLLSLEVEAISRHSTMLRR